MVGFVQKVHGEGDLHKHHAQCFYAKQVEALNIETSDATETDDGTKITKILTHTDGVIKAKATSDKNIEKKKDGTKPIKTVGAPIDKVDPTVTPSKKQ